MVNTDQSPLCPVQWKQFQMATMNRKVTTSDAEQMLCSSSQDTPFCVKCSLIEQQLQFTLTELKSAQAIIALLREDIRGTLHDQSE